MAKFILSDYIDFLQDSASRGEMVAQDHLASMTIPGDMDDIIVIEQRCGEIFYARYKALGWDEYKLVSWRSYTGNWYRVRSGNAVRVAGFLRYMRGENMLCFLQTNRVVIANETVL